MKEKVLLTIQAYNMILQGDKLLVAFSGGADSVALLHFLCFFREELGVTVGALHLNHQLRGEESKRDEDFVRGLCAGLQVPLTVESADVRAVAKKDGEGIEECGRRLRYEFFAREAKRQGAKVALAHTRNDSAETMLLNLARGTGVRGLCGIPPVRGEIIRPLIDCDREDIERYCAENSLPFVTDSTNNSDGYARNRIRRHVIPRLLAENPRLLEHMAAAARILRSDADYLDSLAMSETEALFRPDGGIDRVRFLSLPVALRGRILLNLTRERGGVCERLQVEKLGGIIESGSGRWQISRDLTFRCGRQAFYFDKIKVKQPYFSLQFLLKDIDGEEIIEVYLGKKVKITVTAYKNYEKNKYFDEKGLTYCLDCDKISDIIILRQKLPGDKLRLPGRGCTKTLKNLFQELGVPPEDRLCRVVASDGKGLLWAEGIGTDERVSATEYTKTVVIFEITEGIYAAG